MKSIFLKSVKYLTLLTLIVFLFSELYLRIYESETLVLRDYPKIYDPDSVVGYRGIPNVVGHIRRPSIDKAFTLNSQGFYGPDFKTQRPDSVFRIALIGASNVEGIWANQKESFPDLMGKKFRALGYKVEVINCGVSGEGRDVMNLVLVREAAWRFGAQIVLMEQPLPIGTFNYYRARYGDYSILFTGNNARERLHSRYAAERKIDIVRMHKLVTDLFDMSYCLRGVCRPIDERNWQTLARLYQTYAKNTSESWQYFASDTLNLERGTSLLNSVDVELSSRNSKFMIFQYANDLGDEVDQLLRCDRIFLDIPFDQRNLYHEHDGHFSDVAYEMIADQLCQNLDRYIPERYKRVP